MSGGTEIVSGFTDGAIRSAIAAVIAAGQNGGVVLLPAGTYACSATIAVPSNIILQGIGWQRTTLVAQSDITVLDIIGTGRASLGISNHVASVCVRDLRIDGGSNPAWSTKPMVRMMYAHTCEFSKVVFQNKYGIAFGILAEVWDSSWWQCRWDNCGGINQGLPAMLVQSGDGTASPGFGFSDDATNDLRFWNCTWEAFRDGAYWTRMPANANKVGTNFFFGCKADTVATALGTYFSFESLAGGSLERMNLSYVNPSPSYLGTPFPLISFKGSGAIDITGILHNQGGSGEITALLRFDGTNGSFPNTFFRIADIKTNTNGFSQYTQSIIRFDGGNNSWFNFRDNMFDGMSPALVAPVYSGTIPKQYPTPIAAKAGVFSDADFGTQEPGLPGNVAQIIGYDETNNKLMIRTTAGVYKSSAAFT